MRYRGGGSGSAPSPPSARKASGGAHKTEKLNNNKKKKTQTHVAGGATAALPQQSDQAGGTVHDNSGWHGTWGAGCPQCDSTQGQDASTRVFFFFSSSLQMCIAKQRAAWQWHLSGVSQTLRILMSNLFFSFTPAGLLKTPLPLFLQGWRYCAMF